MSPAGPSVPPHLLAKRKRSTDDASGSDSDQPPNLPRPPSRSTSPENGDKRRRVIGPSLPPAPLDERPVKVPVGLDSNQDDGESSDDDGLGPALPPGPGESMSKNPSQNERYASAFDRPESPKKLQREEWMMIPPSQDDWTSKVDPTKLRNRKFNTGKGSKAPARKSGGDNAMWTETPEQKRKRLEDEVMGIQKPAALGPTDARPSKGAAEAEETARRIKDYNEKNRAQSLYEEHKKAVPKEKEDDPSARGFDREKDIAGGRKIGHAQRKEMLNRAADFGSRFAGGSYL